MRLACVDGQAAPLPQKRIGLLWKIELECPYTPRSPPPHSHRWIGYRNSTCHNCDYLREIDVSKCVIHYTTARTVYPWLTPEYHLYTLLSPLPWWLPPLHLVCERLQSQSLGLRLSFTTPTPSTSSPLILLFIRYNKHTFILVCLDSSKDSSHLVSVSLQSPQVFLEREYI